MWDNRCTQHIVMNDFEEERIIQQVTVVGDVPERAGPARWKPYLRAQHGSVTSRFDRQLNDVLGRKTQSLAGNKTDRN